MTAREAREKAQKARRDIINEEIKSCVCKGFQTLTIKKINGTNALTNAIGEERDYFEDEGYLIRDYPEKYIIAW